MKCNICHPHVQYMFVHLMNMCCQEAGTNLHGFPDYELLNNTCTHFKPQNLILNSKLEKIGQLGSNI